MHCCLGNSYGNYFDPAESCSHVVDNVPKAKNGVYWIKTQNGKVKVSKAIFELFFPPRPLLQNSS